MLNRGDLDLNSIQIHTDSLKERLKQTMLNQELVFMRQVFDLHRLYRIQIAMMEDFKLKGLDNYNLHRGGMGSFPVNFNNQLKNSVVERVQSENCNLQHELQYKHPVFMQKPVHLQLSADEFISQCVNDFPGNRVGSLNELIESKNSSWDEVALDLDNLNLSLRIGQDPGKKFGEHRSCMGQKTCASLHDIIDRKAPNSSFSKDYVSRGLTSCFAAPKPCSKDKHKLDGFLKNDKRKLESFRQSGIGEVSCSTTPSKSLCDSGLNGHHREFVSSDVLSKNQTSASSKANNLDLNTVQLEDSSYSSNNHSVVVNPLMATSSALLDKVYANSTVASSINPSSLREAKVNHFAEISDIHRPNDVNFDLATNSMDEGETRSKDGKSKESNGGKISVIDIDSDSGEELHSSISDPKIESVGSSSKLSNDLSCEVDAVGVEASLEKGVEPFLLLESYQNQVAADEQPNCHNLSSSSETECMIDHQSSSIKTLQSGVKYGNLNFSPSVENQKILTSDSIESNIQCINRKELEVDGTVETAAELLVQISLQTQAICQGDIAKIPLNEFQNIEDDRPQCSSESYEALVLKAKECGPDDYCVSSNAFVVDISKEVCRYKLKRGTRMKDFQKDILPGLSTLLRHEIREDINIIEGVIRSREYKKMRARMGDEGVWCRSRRSKRSRGSRRY